MSTPFVKPIVGDAVLDYLKDHFEDFEPDDIETEFIVTKLILFEDKIRIDGWLYLPLISVWMNLALMLINLYFLIATITFGFNWQGFLMTSLFLPVCCLLLYLSYLRRRTTIYLFAALYGINVVLNLVRLNLPTVAFSLLMLGYILLSKRVRFTYIY